MSREAYQIPTAQAGSSAPGGGSAVRNFDADNATIAYICGDCGFKFPLKRTDAIRCKECGCRILYKERTRRMVQFEAR
ncbi:DNA directed RNA polymerase [Xylariaceae sp. FL1019]|nr:DNA directed RNA polymerase [Xylariaceae sp. FL1019]